ncbi:hypothetical protein [Candidatus Tisiphia endosymbiont of Sialis lutaria]|uniref:hypothetical protein n=1 Tax=Candidatus Tisiphia endosymbiont of Sialis lutaria TaxID=2029164 RepID=UPI00312C78BE
MSYFLQPKRVKYRITLVIVGSLLEVTTSPTSPELTILSIHLKVSNSCFTKLNILLNTPIIAPVSDRLSPKT